MKFLDLFSGIGGFRIGMELAGHECVGHCEIDKFANRSYAAMHNIRGGEWFGEDITKIKPDELPKADIWCFGFPCQDISVAGNRKGLKGSRSGLFYAVIKIIKGIKEENKPSILFIENVRNLLSINNGWDFTRILISLDECGYNVEWQILNSKDYGVPQNRERIYIIGHLRGRSTGKIFPITRSNSKVIKMLMLQINKNNKKYSSVWDRIYLKSGIGPCITTMSRDIKILNQVPISIGYKSDRKYIDVAKCICARDYKEISNRASNAVEVRAVMTPERLNRHQNGRRIKENMEPMFTLTTQDRHGVCIGKLSENYRIRKLTPRECFRLQGFSDKYFEKAASVNSNSQLYKQAGNSVTVNVIYEIASKLRLRCTPKSFLKNYYRLEYILTILTNYI